MEDKTKKLGAGAIVGLVLGGLGGGFIADDSADVDAFQDKVDTLIAEKTALENQEPEIITETITETVIEYVDRDVEVEVQVDNGNLQLVLDEVIDSKGNVKYITDKLDEDEGNLIVDRIIFKNDAVVIAEELVKKDIVEFIDDEEVFFGEDELEEYRDNDVYKVSIYDDNSVFEADDWEDNEATVFVEVKLKLDNGDDKTSQRFIAEVEIEDGEAEIINVKLDK